jgi:hypothetical protein
MVPVFSVYPNSTPHQHNHDHPLVTMGKQSQFSTLNTTIPPPSLYGVAASFLWHIMEEEDNIECLLQVIIVCLLFINLLTHSFHKYYLLTL